MSLLDEYKEKLEAQIREHKAQLDFLKAKARRVAVQSKFVGHQQLAEADKHLDHVKARFNELKGVGGEALAEIRTGLKNALADLKISTKKAAEHFNAPPPPPPKSTRTAKPAKPAAKAKAKVVRTVKHTARAVKRSKPVRAAKSAQPGKARKH
jgi:hypothetical protein